MHLKNLAETMEYLLQVSYEKGNKKSLKLAVLGFMAGMFIAFGAVGSILTSSSFIKTNIGLSKFVAGSVFPVGLMLVLMLGAELFTSNTMLMVGVIDKRIPFSMMLRNWFFVYIFNFLGGIFIAYITIVSKNFNADSLEYLEHVVLAKVSTPAAILFFKGILCNVLVCGAVLIVYAADNMIGKLLGAWFPIMLFIVLGYEHSVANMLYLSAGKLMGAEITYLQIAYNLTFVTLGNIVGGTLFMSLPLYYAYYSKKDKEA